MSVQWFLLIKRDMRYPGTYAVPFFCHLTCVGAHYFSHGPPLTGSCPPPPPPRATSLKKILESPLPQCDNMELNIIQSLLKMVQLHKKCWETTDFVGPKEFFWRTEVSLTVQDKQGTHEQLSQKHTQKQTIAVDHSGNNTVLRIKCM